MPPSLRDSLLSHLDKKTCKLLPEEAVSSERVVDMGPGGGGRYGDGGRDGGNVFPIR